MQRSVAARNSLGDPEAFDLDAQAVEPAPSDSGTGVAAEAQTFTEDGECPGEVLVFTQADYLS